MGAQRRQADGRVGGGPPGHLDPVTHELGDPRDPLPVDESHRPRLDTGGLERLAVHVGDPVDDGVPQAHDVDAGPPGSPFEAPRPTCDDMGSGTSPDRSR